LSRSAQLSHTIFEGTCSMEGAVCENCGKGTMRRFAQDTFYHYLKCQNKACEKERLEPITCEDQRERKGGEGTANA
jgi:hypothetical protein